MISTRNIQSLPSIDALRTLSQSLAVLDAIVEPEWEYRYYSFDCHWSSDEMLASMRNGSGDSYVIVFSPAGAVILGADHERPVWGLDQFPIVLTDLLPHGLQEVALNPAISADTATFCIWRQTTDTEWNVPRGNYSDDSDPDSDGSQGLLSILDGNPATYQSWANEYYNVSLNLDGVAQIYRYTPLTDRLVSQIRPVATLSELKDDIQQIGYPVLANSEDDGCGGESSDSSGSMKA